MSRDPELRIARLRLAISAALLDAPLGLRMDDLRALAMGGERQVSREVAAMLAAGEILSRASQTRGGPITYYHPSHAANIGQPAPARPSSGEIADAVRRPIERLAPGRVEWRTIAGRRVQVTIGPSHQPEAELERTAPRLFRGLPIGHPSQWGGLV